MSRNVKRPRIPDKPDEAESVRQRATRAIEVVVLFVFAIGHLLILAEHSVNVNEGVCYARHACRMTYDRSISSATFMVLSVAFADC
jgi:hypothetical protein